MFKHKFYKKILVSFFIFGLTSICIMTNCVDSKYIHPITSMSFAKEKSTFNEKDTKILKQTSITLVGDSVAFNTSPILKELFADAYVDCKVSRQLHDGVKIIEKLHSQKKINEILVVALGSNGPFTDKDLDRIYACAQGKKLLFVNCVVPHKIEKINNKKFSDFAESHKDVYIVDWYGFAKNKTKLFYKDKTHPIPKGDKLYAELIAKKVLSIKEK